MLLGQIQSQCFSQLAKLTALNETVHREKSNKEANRLYAELLLMLSPCHPWVIPDIISMSSLMSPPSCPQCCPRCHPCVIPNVVPNIISNVIPLLSTWHPQTLKSHSKVMWPHILTNQNARNSRISHISWDFMKLHPKIFPFKEWSCLLWLY